MDSVMPEGFFGNTQEIYAEVASYPVVPPEKIKQYWHVYTTTFRRLFDPSAFRLENFWWHVWGSERLRGLSGPVLAKLFEEFSDGPTFMPLPSPAGRLMLARAAGSRRREVGSHSTEEAPPPRNDDSGQGPGPSGSKKEPVPSAEAPQPAHSILKKTRGPSTSGPRPTARFASPPASYEEAICAGEDAPTSRPATNISEMPPPPLPSAARSKQAAAPPSATDTPPPPSRKPTLPSPLPALSETDMPPPPPPLVSPVKADKAATNTGRRIVVGSKRRPVIPRRLSSQSSTGSETGQRVAGSATASKRSGSKKTTTTTTTTPSGSQQSSGPGSSSSQASEAGISAKAAGKRPAKGKRSSSSSWNTPAQDKALGTASETTGEVSTLGVGGASHSPRDTTTQARQRAPAPSPLPVAGFVTDHPAPRRGPPAMIRSRSNNNSNNNNSEGGGPPGHRDPGVALLPSQATSSVATFITTAQGHFDSETVTAEPLVPEARDIPDRVRYGGGSYPLSSSASAAAAAAVLDLQFRPTPPSTAPPIPFGRSKSELTLLLARGQKEEG